MLNPWDAKKQSIYDEIHSEISWKMEESKTDSTVKLVLSFVPPEGSSLKGDFPEITYSYADKDKFDEAGSAHYDSMARFYTMVALNEDILLGYKEDFSTIFRIQSVALFPTAAERAVPYRRFGRFRFSGGKVSLVAGPVDSFYESSKPTSGGFEVKKVSLLF